MELTPEQVAAYFKRNYTAVDGLWFVKVEEQCGFEAALQVDNEVWQVLPKIQARTLQALTGLGGGEEALLECLTLKFSLEGFKFQVEKREGGFDVLMTDCPWHNQMVKSGRVALSDRVGSVICPTENSVFAAEFVPEMRFELQTQICQGATCCTFSFRHP